MIRIQILGEGPRDACAVPPLIENLLDCRTTPEFTAWSDGSLQRFHRKGLPKLGKKLLFALSRASADGMHGVIALIDDDCHDGDRVEALRAGREAHRHTSPAIPAAVGSAIPHFEAWLLDDPRAVRDALRLPRNHAIPSPVGTNSPKETLHQLFVSCPRCNDDIEKDVLPDIARNVKLERCNQRHQTGLQDFADDLREEFKAIEADGS